MAKAKLSLVIITLNEAENIQRCIRSVPFADEVIVLDSGSQDQTLALAEALGARTFTEKWRGYRDQKKRAVELASHDWILSLDGDEALSSQAAEELLELLLADLSTIDGFEFPRLSHHMDRWIHHGGWYPDWQLRAFHRGRAGWQAGGHVHERVRAERVKRLKNPILHWPFPTLAEQINTNNNYSSLGARDLFERGKKFSLLKLIFKPLSKFIETYLIKRGFMDGLPGFIVAVGAAYSVFLKFAKLKELEMKQVKRVST